PVAAPVVAKPVQPKQVQPQPVGTNGAASHAAAAPKSVAPAPVPVKPAAVASAAPRSAPPAAELEAFLINFVVEQTGYPREVVELDADLEADLGIDSIKKAQLFGELAEYFDVQATEGMTLDEFPTLRHVLNFLQGTPMKGVSGPPPATASTQMPAHSSPVSALASGSTAMSQSAISPPAAAIKAGGPAPEQLETFLINFVVEQTGYPPEVVELDADLEAYLGIESIKKAQLFGELA